VIIEGSGQFPQSEFESHPFPKDGKGWGTQRRISGTGI
jgi:hypothetical protein